MRSAKTWPPVGMPPVAAVHVVPLLVDQDGARLVGAQTIVMLVPPLEVTATVPPLPAGLAANSVQVRPSLVENPPSRDPVVPTTASRFGLVPAKSTLVMLPIEPPGRIAPEAGDEVSVECANPLISPTALNSGAPDGAPELRLITAVKSIPLSKNCQLFAAVNVVELLPISVVHN